MDVSLAKREDERTHHSNPTYHHHRHQQQQQQPPPPQRRHERINHNINVIQTPYPSLSIRDMTPGSSYGLSSSQGPRPLFSQGYGEGGVVMGSGYPRAEGSAPSIRGSSRGDAGSFVSYHRPFPGDNFVTSYPGLGSSLMPGTSYMPSGLHERTSGNMARHEPPRHSPPSSYNLVGSISPQNSHMPMVCASSPSSPTRHSPMGDYSPPHSQASMATTRPTVISSRVLPTTQDDGRSSSTPWGEVKKEPAITELQVNPAALERSSSSGSGGPSTLLPQSPLVFGKDLEPYLSCRDYGEIKELHDLYSTSFDLPAPIRDRMIKTEELGKLYSHFIQKRAKFLVNTPLYKTLAQEDRQKLLHTAVAMSTYFTGAHLIDMTNYTWKAHNGTDKSSPIMSATTIRPVLTHEQFMFVMRYYTTYSPFFTDLTVAILMQVLSLFYPEPGLVEQEVVEQGRLHYLGLLSRYLAVTHGPHLGEAHLRTLLDSQREARHLVHLLQHVDLTPRVPRRDLVASRKLLVEGIQLVCDRARNSLAMRDTTKGPMRDSYRILPGPCNPAEALLPVGSSRTQDTERVAFIQDTLIRLANCEDPHTLEKARRILPPDLILKFFHQQQGASMTQHLSLYRLTPSS
ncbi:uncharacterized protein LOC121867556 [Homarus americanus]|uniref:Putative Vitamin D3 receptor B-like 3 n=1 Tax=Homarus americanus TaxID=6706 RepID=A0A8J5MXJ6_HOMAM|nr:uncharacterized protein LOC121865616 [Homarus americanus]XP_042223494.1 uncharacterized protein LOC121867556 [Homarus americanus]KAG7168125.1 putative Vitamin D3 receptor B-like 4 [Homarus americanus]KAG7169586.1 putative Vitamin D3 receptor B-like 3 [Homarus americanus]